MQVKKSIESTKATLTIIASEADLSPLKQQTLERLQSRVKVAGFRAGKVPLALVEKNVDQQTLQSEFLEEAISAIYSQVIRDAQLRVVDRPEVQLTKFVPFTTLEFTAVVQVISDVKLGDYKKLKAKKPEVTVTEADVKEVIKSLQTRMSEKKDVDRAAKDTDQVWIDFKGVDPKGEPVQGADGKEYPLILGSNTFIPGFEPELIGLKAGDEKTFTTTFPKDYRVSALAGKKVTFTVNVTKIQEVIEPKADDDFASLAGPFTSMKDLKEDIKKQLNIERSKQADRDYESALVKQLTDASELEVPEVLIDNQVERMVNELKQNLMYRGQTIEEFYKSEGTDEEGYKKNILRPQAEERVKAGIVLSEVADKEGLTVTPEELDIRIDVLKAQYQDKQMQDELNKPENRQDIASRLLTEKTLAKIISFVA